MKDVINNPSHYTHGSIECIDVIKDWKLGYHLGNALKYICRAEHKGNALQDIGKAIWYLEDYRRDLERKNVVAVLARKDEVDANNTSKD